VVELIAVHIPKTAGITFQTILNQVYGTQCIYYDYLESSIPRVYEPADIPSEIRAIHGHFPINKYDNFFPDAKRIVWLRHPIYLLISLYFYWRNIPAVKPDKNSIVSKVQHTKMGLYEFADQPEVINIFCQNIGGRQLTDFYFIGIQEFFTQDLGELKTLLGWPTFNICQANINPNLKYEDDLQEIFANKTIINKLFENNREDLGIYQEALNLRAKRRKESSLMQPFLGEWNRGKYRINQILSSTNILESSNFVERGKNSNE
jgi:hypothetical protein